jgi:hypothetical protein
MGILKFDDNHRVYIVPRLEDELIDELFYQEEEIGEFRHTAFLIECGLEEDPTDDRPDVEPIPWLDNYSDSSGDAPAKKPQPAPAEPEPTRRIPSRASSMDGLEEISNELSPTTSPRRRVQASKAGTLHSMRRKISTRSHSDEDIDDTSLELSLANTENSKPSSPRKGRGLVAAKSGSLHGMREAARKAKEDKAKEDDSIASPKAPPVRRKLVAAKSGTLHGMRTKPVEEKNDEAKEEELKKPSPRVPSRGGLVAAKSGTLHGMRKTRNEEKKDEPPNKGEAPPSPGMLRRKVKVEAPPSPSSLRRKLRGEAPPSPGSLRKTKTSIDDEGKSSKTSGRITIEKNEDTKPAKKKVSGRITIVKNEPASSGSTPIVLPEKKLAKVKGKIFIEKTTKKAEKKDSDDSNSSSDVELSSNDSDASIATIEESSDDEPSSKKKSTIARRSAKPPSNNEESPGKYRSMSPGKMRGRFTISNDESPGRLRGRTSVDSAPKNPGKPKGRISISPGRSKSPGRLSGRITVPTIPPKSPGKIRGRIFIEPNEPKEIRKPVVRERREKMSPEETTDKAAAALIKRMHVRASIPKKASSVSVLQIPSAYKQSPRSLKLGKARVPSTPSKAKSAANIDVPPAFRYMSK